MNPVGLKTPVWQRFAAVSFSGLLGGGLQGSDYKDDPREHWPLRPKLEISLINQSPDPSRTLRLGVEDPGDPPRHRNVGEAEAATGAKSASNLAQASELVDPMVEGYGTECEIHGSIGNRDRFGVSDVE